MEEVIKKAMEGGFIYSKGHTKKEMDWIINLFSENKYEVVCNPLFWQALGKSCGWEKHPKRQVEFHQPLSSFTQTGIEKYHALRFHEINLAEGWDKAVDYLSSLIKE